MGEERLALGKHSATHSTLPVARKVLFRRPHAVDAEAGELYVPLRNKADCVKVIFVGYVGEHTLRRIHLLKSHECLGPVVPAL